MPTKIKGTPELVTPAGSHHLALNDRSQSPEVFSKEELYPVLALEVPRVGFVRAQFSVDRYVASYWNGREGTSRDGWGDWRIYLSAVRTPDAERPDLPHLGTEASGIGPATREAITEACEPIIRAWLDSDEYASARRLAVSRAMRRELDAPRSYTLNRAERTFQRLRDELGPKEAERLWSILRLLDQAAEELEAEPLAD